MLRFYRDREGLDVRQNKLIFEGPGAIPEYVYAIRLFDGDSDEIIWTRPKVKVRWHPDRPGRAFHSIIDCDGVSLDLYIVKDLWKFEQPNAYVYEATYEEAQPPPE